MVVLDASTALAWHLKRTDAGEAKLAQLALRSVILHGAAVPALWHAEVANGLLFAERQKVSSEHESERFLADLATLGVAVDPTPPEAVLRSVLSIARASRLTAYDAVYLELALRTASPLATFDRQLAKAARKAGARIFGDRP